MTRKTPAAAFALAFALSATSLFAQGATWQLDGSHSRAQFAVKHMMVSTVRGQFTKTTGTGTWDGKSFTTASIDVTIDAASISTGIEGRDNHLRSADFFDVAKFPTITFKSTKIEQVSPGKLKMTGDLTLHGVTRSVVLDVDGPSAVMKEQNGLRVGASATGKINRKDFGLTWNRAIEAGGVTVSEEVALTIDVEFVNRPAK
jgi:polyisoprenoid-binding protein YceI